MNSIHGFGNCTKCKNLFATCDLDNGFERWGWGHGETVRLINNPLKDLAEGRNEVAHGHSDPVLFGKAKATSDLQRLAVRVDEVIDHFVSSLDDYLAKKQYAR